MRRRVFFVAAVSVLAACSSPTRVDVTNRSTVAITEVVVVGNQANFKQALGTLRAGETKSVEFEPSGEASGIGLEFKAGARYVKHPEYGYFEQGQLAAVTVDASLTVTVQKVDGHEVWWRR